jgi:hypothetical protein
VRRLEALIELRIATGRPDEELLEQWRSSVFFEAFLRRRLPDTEIQIAYPSIQIGEVLLSHGHYLDGEVRGSVPNRLLQGGFWRIAGGRVTTPRIGDYEAALVPLTELLFVEAQLPKGAAAEQRIQAELRVLGHRAELAAAPGRELARLGRYLRRRLQGTGEPPAPGADYVLARGGRPRRVGAPCGPGIRSGMPQSRLGSASAMVRVRPYPPARGWCPLRRHEHRSAVLEHRVLDLRAS